MISGFFMIVALAAACVFGARFEPWPWGPGLLALAAALVASALEPGSKSLVPRGMAAWAAGLVVVACAWFVWRAAGSPVADYARADLLLLAGMAGSLLWGVSRGGAARSPWAWLVPLGLLVAVNAGVALFQVAHPGYSLLHGQRPPGFPSGLFGHYNYFSCFMIGATLLLGGIAACGGGHGFARALAGMASLTGMIAVVLSKSRGGLVGLAAGVLVLGLLLLPVLRRRWRRGFAILVCVLPLFLLAGAFAAAKALGESQQARRNAPTAEALLDNDRLMYLRVAVDTLATHPWQGGGSQSFRWESREAWDPATVGHLDRDLLFVHNELMQAFTDYGLIGGGLVLLALAAVLVAGLAALWIGRGGDARSSTAAQEGILAGALAGLCGVLVQSNFCIVLHVLPNAMMLGLLAGMVLGASRGDVAATGQDRFAWFGRVAMLALGLSFSWVAWKGLEVTQRLLPLEHARATRQPLGLSEAITRLRGAAVQWPHPSLYNDMGNLWFEAAMTAGDSARLTELGSLAVEAYGKSLERDPHDPEPSVNRARVLSLLDHFAESEREFARAIGLQHKMEYAFEARHFLARHYQRKFAVLWSVGDREGARAALDSALEQAAICREEVPHGEGGRNGRALNAQLAALDSLVRADDAFRQGQKLWMQRQPESALGKFLEARQRLSECQRHPETAQQADTMKLAGSVEDAIRFLQGAGIKPPG